MFGYQPSLWTPVAGQRGPTEAERRILDLRNSGLTYREIERELGVKVKAAKFRVNSYHRRAGIVMPPHRPRHQMTKRLYGGYEYLI